MPEHKPRNKAERQAAVKTVMHEFKEGDLHSGSKQGPKVKNPKQAVAIAMSESGQSNKKKYDRSAHFKGNPGFPSDPKAKSPPDSEYEGKTYKDDADHGPSATYAKHEEREKEVMGAGYEMHEKAERQGWGNGSHSFPQVRASAHGFGHGGGQRQGHLRTSGHSGAHQIGKRRK